MARAWEVPGLGARTRFRTAAGRVIITRWRETMSYRDGTLRGGDPEQLHDMRVASRRLRAAMDAFEGAFPRRSFRRLRREVREITDTLGAARDLDVAIARLEALLAEAAEEQRPGIAGLIARHREERAAETPRIAALFERLEAEGLEERLESYVHEHTGVSPAEVDARPPRRG